MCVCFIFPFSRNQLVSSVELSNQLSDIRFVRLPAIKYANALNFYFFMSIGMV